MEAELITVKLPDGSSAPRYVMAPEVYVSYREKQAKRAAELKQLKAELKLLHKGKTAKRAAPLKPKKKTSGKTKAKKM